MMKGGMMGGGMMGGGMMKGSKTARHGSDGGEMPMHRKGSEPPCMGGTVNTPSNTDRSGGATSFSGGKPHGSVKNPTGPVKAPKVITHAQGPSKYGK